MNATKYVQSWFTRGDDDLIVAKLILDRGTGSPNLACFHAQQAAEKYLKGFLAHRELHVRKIHDLDILLKECSNTDPSLVQLQDDARYLNQFYIESRYPDDFVLFTDEEAKKAFEGACRIKEFVLSRISVPEQTEQNGFGLIGILIVIALIALAGGGGLYVKETRNQKTIQQIGIEKLQEAEALKQKIEEQQTQDRVANESQQQGISVDDLKNAIYHLTFFDNQEVHLKDGVYKGSEIRDSVSRLQTNIYNNLYALGDIDQDNIVEAAVILTTNGGGTGSFRELAILKKENGVPTEIASQQLGDRSIIHAIKIEDSYIMIDITITGEDDPACCPTVHKNLKYKLLGRKLQEVQ